MALPLVPVVLATFVLYLLRTRYHAGMSKFNGPLLASFTDFWKIWYVWRRASKPHYLDLHKKYGDIVRVGPNELSFANPKAIHEIYGPKGINQKSKEYSIPGTAMNGKVQHVLFSSLDTEWHDRERRLVAPAFSMSQMISYEPCIDENISLLIDQWRKRFASTGTPMDIMDWATYWSLETIYDLTFGERMGYIEQGRDINNFIDSVRKTVWWFKYLTRAPILDYILFKNPIALWFNKKGWFESPNVFGPIIERQFMERHEYWKEVGSLKTKSMDKPTLTEQFLRAQQEHPELEGFQPMMHAMTIIGAATEPTAISISSIFYFILKNPTVYKTLKAELSAFPRDKPISYNTAQSLPYLMAVINESMRLHVADKFPHTRLVPPSGLTISNTFIPGETSVSVWPDVSHRNKDVYGQDVDVFRPERWLGEGERGAMGTSMLSFGRGNFGCLGRNLARVEVIKFIAEVVREFDFELVDFEKEWKIVNGPFPHPIDLLIRVREGKSA